MDRIQTLNKQVGASSASSVSSSADDVVICGAVRTALCKAKKGSLKDTAPEELVKFALQGLVKKTGVDPKVVQDVAIGNVLQPGAGALTARMGQLLAGFPNSSPVYVINRQCSSGLQACANIAGAIKAGHIDVGIAGGVESMSNNDMQSSLNPESISENVFEHEEARNCLMPMGVTSENVAAKFNVSRERQDTFAALSHKKAAEAQKAGLFKDEIVPVVTKIKNKDGSESVITVVEDDGIRAETTPESLSKLKPAFQKGGSTTAGNSSQVTDGAAAVLLARRSVAEKMGLPIIGRFVAFSVVGCPPEIMGIGPAVAIPAVLKQAGMNLDDIDIFEINEAFASQALYCTDVLKVPAEKLNPKGGAIAFGHPLGATGARQIATLMPELKRQKKRFGLTSMCIGTGMGAAAIIESYQ
eukprot:GDKJ01049884.1.p1 GENE.GDKJ01049884.1~~GDKJ01049884.1.p1  ORF type:complete len:414 (+),score=151.56 GDKJ01049884.1:24-1265(+)